MTAVEWLVDELIELSNMGLSISQYSSLRKNIFEQAKEMEKEQMIEFASYYTPFTKEELEIGFNHKFKQPEQ